MRIEVPAHGLLWAVAWCAIAASWAIASGFLAQWTPPGGADTDSQLAIDGLPIRAGTPLRDPDSGSSETISWWNDPSLTSLERVEAGIVARAATGADRIPNYRYGPVERRIERQRLRQLFLQFSELSGDESWALLQAEPDDPNSPSIRIVIPAEGGPNCPEEDLDEALLRERQMLLDQQGATPGSGVLPTSSSPATPPIDELQVLRSRRPEELHPHPVQVLVYDEDRPELEWIESIIRNRESRGWDRLSDCYYGPVDVRIDPTRLDFLLKGPPGLSGEDYWRAIMAEPRDEDAPRSVVIVRSGTAPDCPAGDIDERLRERRERLLEIQATGFGP